MNFLIQYIHSLTLQPTCLTTAQTYVQLSNQSVEAKHIKELVEYVKGELTNDDLMKI